MSRIGKLPVNVPAGISVELKDNILTVTQGKKKFEQPINPLITVDYDKAAGVIKFTRANDTKQSKMLHGLYRSLIHNMMVGLSTGFSRELEIVGVGFRAEMKENQLNLQLGYSHAIVFIPPENIQIVVEKPTSIVIKGHDKQLVGQVAAKIRSFRPPEPYKGKGIKYVEEVVRRKAGKAAGK
ncbi:50S ribosomal protein L6 [candidate division KSB1 bacterium]|nr:50S ribosomal protein L6 [candidate division KSB1 bacterium]